MERKTAQGNQPTFRFLPRWKEELVVTGPGGSFILELPMGVLTACLPTEESWRSKAPAWAHDLWPTLKAELEAWCAFNNAGLEISEDAGVWPAEAPAPAAPSEGQAPARGRTSLGQYAVVFVVMALVFVFLVWLRRP